MATLFRVPPRTALCRHQRAFSTTTPRAISLQLDRNDPNEVADTVPAYPYGPARWYKQQRLGLYGGQMIRFGNNVGPEFGVKTRRSWHPNIVNKKLFSKALNRTVQVRVSTRVLRTIDKLGGLDEYLLGEKEARIKTLGESGWWLRWAIMQTPTIKKRFAEERQRLGVPEAQVLQEQADVEEAQEVFEEATEAEAAYAEESGEAITTDDAFEIEQPADLPALKFRVGPGQHLVLTSTGWKRTRPGRVSPAQKEAELAKLRKMVLKNKSTHLERKINEANEAAKKTGSEDEVLTGAERKHLRHAAMKQWKAEAEVEVPQLWQYRRDQDALMAERSKAEKRAARRRRDEQMGEEVADVAET